MDVNPNAPVLTRDEIFVDAPLDVVWTTQTHIAAWPRWRPEVRAASFDGDLAVGSVLYWEEGGLPIASTVQEIDPPRRLVWSGLADCIDAIHVWEFTPTDGGVLVHTEESWDGEPVRAQSAILQPLLDAAIRAWLTSLKRAVEQAEAGRRRAPPPSTAAP
jgi:polyketide cyclase/dehydrase/lipid transport protein